VKFAGNMLHYIELLTISKIYIWRGLFMKKYSLILVFLAMLAFSGTVFVAERDIGNFGYNLPLLTVADAAYEEFLDTDEKYLNSYFLAKVVGVSTSNVYFVDWATPAMGGGPASVTLKNMGRVTSAKIGSWAMVKRDEAGTGIESISYLIKRAEGVIQAAQFDNIGGTDKDVAGSLIFGGQRVIFTSAKLQIINGGTKQVFDGEGVLDVYKIIKKGTYVAAWTGTTGEGLAVTVLLAGKNAEGDCAVQTGIKLRVNEYEVPGGGAVIKYNRTLVPVRVVTESLGAQVAWDAASRTATVKYTLRGVAKTLVMSVGARVVSEYSGIVNEYNLNTQYGVAVAPTLIDGRVYLPARVLVEIMDMDIDWDSETRTVNITSTAL
jgi:hypothetical protein